MGDFKLPQVELQLLGENGFWVLVDCFDQQKLDLMQQNMVILPSLPP